jgi:L,D-transpeptidase YcbB
MRRGVRDAPMKRFPRNRSGAARAAVLLPVAAVVAVTAAFVLRWHPAQDAAVMRRAATVIGDSVANVDGDPDHAAITAVYENNGFRPVFVGPRGLTRRGRDIIGALESARKDGLDPADYGVDRIRARLDRSGDRSIDPAQRGNEAALADLDLTLGYARLVHDVARGRARPSRAQPSWKIQDPDSTAPTLAHVFGKDGNPDEAIDGLRPRSAQYAALLELRVRLQRVADAGGWPGPAAAGSSGASATAALRARLLAGIDDTERNLAAQGASDFGRDDAALDSAVSSFQRRHGLPVTGSVDADTRAALNVSASARVRQVDINLERWRWMPRTLGKHVLLVNVPEYVLRYYRDGAQQFDMRVVVGRPDWKTDLFSSSLDRIVLNPYWNVPESILEEDLVADLRDDPQSLERKGFEVLDSRGDVIDPGDVDWDVAESATDRGYRLRQKPGAQNALGYVKFLFPNPYGIYLHDSPAKSLFADAFRARSHGCVRVADPVQLARRIVSVTGSADPDSVEAAMATHETQQIEMNEPVAVFLGYFTAWVDEEGRVKFLPDVYGYDRDFRGPTARASVALAASPAAR